MVRKSHLGMTSRVRRQGAGLFLAVLLVAPQALGKKPAPTTTAQVAPAAQNGSRPARQLPPPTAALTTLPPRFSATRPSLRVPALVALGLGGLGAGGAVVTGIAAQGSRNEVTRCGTECGGGQAPPDSALSITSAVLSVVAAAAVTTGVVLLLTESNRTENKKSLSPSLRLRLAPDKAAASAVWKF